MKRKIFTGLIGLGIFFQILVPSWMMLKHHLIVDRGEIVTIKVQMWDPRDLLMGHYVRLHPTEDLPEILKGLPRDYLRYYCDQKYAKKIDETMSQRHRSSKAIVGELDVKVWRGNPLAVAFRINGIPAYEYVDKAADEKSADKIKEEEKHKIFSILSLDGESDSESSKSGRIIVKGKGLKWNREKADEGIFFEPVTKGGNQVVQARILETLKEDVCFLVEPLQPLTNGAYNVVMFMRIEGEDKITGFSHPRLLWIK